MKGLIRNCVSLALVAGLALGHALADDTNEADVSEANKLLFLSPHLEVVSHPGASLTYELEKSGTKEPGFTDSITIEVQEIHDDDRKHVTVDYLTGDRQRAIPPVERARGNPILLTFLQRDVGNMARDTGGQWQYFQNRMRRAFDHGALVEDVTFEYDGREVEGKEIRIAPFLNDPQKDEFPRYERKYYIFVISDDVPGWIYEIRAVVPDPEDEMGEPWLKERLTLVDYNE